MIWLVVLVAAGIGMIVSFFALGYLIGREKGMREGIEYYRRIYLEVK